eukprot:926430_1
MICDTLNGQCHLGDSLVLETTETLDNEPETLDNEPSENDMMTTSMNDLKTTWSAKESAKTSVDVFLIAIVAICSAVLVCIIVFGCALLRMVKENNQVMDRDDVVSESGQEQIQIENKDMVKVELKIIEDITNGFVEHDVMNDMEVIGDDATMNDTVKGGENDEMEQSHDDDDEGIDTLRVNEEMHEDEDNVILSGLDTLRVYHECKGDFRLCTLFYLIYFFVFVVCHLFTVFVYIDHILAIFRN